MTTDEIAAATNPTTGAIDPRFCITCRRLCDWRKQDWFWNGDNHGQEHFVCRGLQVPRFRFRWPLLDEVIIEWTRNGGIICRLFGHRPVMSNPSAYDCARCDARGSWRWYGHGPRCYHKYTPTFCDCESESAKDGQ